MLATNTGNNYVTKIYYLLVPLAIKVLYFSYTPKGVAGYFNAFELMAEAVILTYRAHTVRI